MLVACKLQRTGDTVNVLCVFMMFIITVLILHINKYVKTTEGPDRQAENINKTESFVFKQKAPRSFEVGSEHDNLLNDFR